MLTSSHDSFALLVQARLVLWELAHLASKVFPPNLSVRADLPAELWPILADPSEIHQALVHLLLNARAAMPEGGQIVLSACNVTVRDVPASSIFDAQPGDYVKIAVSDTGSGTDQYLLKSIMGLRLARVAHVLRQHGGFAAVQSGFGRGATVSLFFPRAMVEGIPVDPVAGSANRPARGILVVDDEEAFRASSSQVLSRAGFEVLLARVGREALTLFEQRRCDIVLVLVDLAMTDMNAFTFVWALCRSRPELHVIVVTRPDSEETFGEIKRVGVRQILEKPIASSYLLDSVTQTLAEPARFEPGLFLGGSSCHGAELDFATLDRAPVAAST